MDGAVTALTVSLDFLGESVQSREEAEAAAQMAVRILESIVREGLQANIDRYLTGGTSPTNPLANPLFADFHGFPRLYICAGDIESLFDDSVRLDSAARAAGVDVTFSIGRGMQHVYPFLAGRHPRADREIADIASWYRAGRAALAA